MTHEHRRRLTFFLPVQPLSLSPAPRTLTSRRYPTQCVSSPPDDANATPAVSVKSTTRIKLKTTDVHPDKTETRKISESTTKLLEPPPSPPPPESSPLVEWATTAKVGSGFAAVLALIGALAFASSDGGVMEGPSGNVVRALNEFVGGPHFLVSIGMGASAFIQALTGFGFAIVSVGALTQLDWVVNSSVFDVVQPVAATLGAATGWALLLPELHRVEWRKLSALLAASTLATPLGVKLLEMVDGHVVLRSLGALIAGYVGYSVAGVQVPKKMGGNAGAWVMGILAGALGGAFDITGPPLVMFGDAAEWSNDDGTFRRNVLAVVSVNSTVVVLYDALVGRLNDFYYWDFVKYAAPAVVAGVLIGNWLSSRLDPSAFKKVVLGTCMALGAKLLFS